MKPVKAVRTKVQKVQHPAETAAPVGFAALTAVLVSFGVPADKAAAIAGLVAALTPAAVTFAREKGWV